MIDAVYSTKVTLVTLTGRLQLLSASLKITSIVTKRLCPLPILVSKWGTCVNNLSKVIYMTVQPIDCQFDAIAISRSADNSMLMWH